MKFPKIMNRSFFSVLMILAFASISLAQAKSTATKADAKRLPNLVLNTIGGKKWSLYENLGKVVLINFWATWCAPCREETPMLVELQKLYKSKGLEVVGIALDEDGAEIIKKFAAEYKINYPILLPVPGSLLAQTEPVPTTILINRRGALAKKYIGAIPADIIRPDLEELIKTPGAKAKTGNKRKTKK